MKEARARERDVCFFLLAVCSLVGWGKVREERRDMEPTEDCSAVSLLRRVVYVSRREREVVRRASISAVPAVVVVVVDAMM